MAKKHSDRGDGRDAKGRWTKDTSGNLKGRPTSVPDLDMADLINFSRFPTEITISGEKQLMTRHEIVWFKVFESALKGRITAQKYLIEKIEQAQMSREYLEFYLDKWADRLSDDPASVPREVVFMMETIMASRGPRYSRIRTRKGGKQKRS